MKRSRDIRSAYLAIDRDGVMIVVEVKGEYIPEEKPVYYYADGSGHPGSPATVEDIVAKCGHDEIELTEGEIEDAIKLLLED